jgi:hypothetical protein
MSVGMLKIVSILGNVKNVTTIIFAISIAKTLFVTKGIKTVSI